MCERTGGAQAKAFSCVTGGKIFMCGGKHENTWLDRYFKDQENRRKKQREDKKTSASKCRLKIRGKESFKPRRREA